MTQHKLESRYILPLRDVVIFPRMVLPLYIGRQSSIQSLLNALNAKEEIALVCQKDASIITPQECDLYRTGVIAKILQIFRLPDGTIKILIEGSDRVSLSDVQLEKDHYIANIQLLESTTIDVDMTSYLLRSLVKAVDEYSKLSEVSSDFLSTLKAIDDPGVYADLVASHLPITVENKQALLVELNVMKRVEKVLYYIGRETEWMQVDRRIQERVRDQISSDQKNYFKREKLKAIQNELTEESDGLSEIDQLENKITELTASDDVIERLLVELSKLRMMPPMSSDSAVVRNYLDVAVDLPWDKTKKLNANISKAHKRLEKDHYGLKSVKERILEAIAMQMQNKGSVKGPILCIVGPPGVGKTSLGRAVADALGRPFARISLGGVRDESEIRGHRRTYIGAMPGRLIKAMRKAKYSNPLILLDEIDKVGMDFRGDPASALLEVLDPEQNKSFNDHYLELDYDLSNVFFMTTANTLDISPPLLDRMEIIRIPGYTDEEKISIAVHHILPKLLDECGMKKKDLKISDDTVRHIIRDYTREAGVRELERVIYKLCRQWVKRKHSGEDAIVNLSYDVAKTWLGTPKFSDDKRHVKPEVGLVNGLAWTSVGGELLQIETIMYPGKGELVLTGSLGDVMQESIRAAWSFVKLDALKADLTIEHFQSHDIHVHVPDGATPKDGPSAGIAIATAMSSVVKNLPVKDSIAMTGEITLRGTVLKIGGLKEKLIAAHRHKVETVFIPSDNLPDLQDVPNKVCEDLKIIAVSHVSEVFESALLSTSDQ